MISYVLVPNPVLQLTDSAGNFVPYGTIETLNWDTRQPKATYFDPGGLKPRSNPFQLDQVGRAFTVYWEDDTAYYLVLRNQTGQIVWQSAEPYVPSSGGGSVVTNNIEFENLFINGQMRFFPIGLYEPIADGTTDDIADGGWSFSKDGANLDDRIEFVRFTLDESAVDATPIYYFNYVADAPGTMETQKSLNFRIQDVRSLSDEQVTVSVEARSDLMGTVPLEIVAIQNFGSASMSVTPSAPVITALTTVNLTTSWARYSITAILPNLTGKTLGENGDDFLSIAFGMPLNEAANIQLTNFYLKRGADTDKYPYQTYEEVLSELSILPRHTPTTDFDSDTTLYPSEEAYNALMLVPSNGVNQLAWLPPVPIGTVLPFPSDIEPPGWVMAKGQMLIKNGQYNRLYNVPFSGGVFFGDAYSVYTDTENNTFTESNFAGMANVFLAIETDSGVPNSWDAGTSPFVLTQVTIGHASEGISNNVPFDMVTAYFINDANGAVAAPTTDTSMTINITTLGSPTTKAQWDILAIAASSISASQYVAYHTTVGSYYVWFNKDGVGTDPALPGYTGSHEIKIVTGNTALEVSLMLQRGIVGYESWSINCTAASTIKPGDYFSVGTIGVLYAVYYRIDGSNTIPSLPDQLVPVDILSTDTNAEVATKTALALNPLLFKMPDFRGSFIRFWDDGRGLDPDAASRTNRGDGTTGDKVGTYQDFALVEHTHEVYFLSNAGSGGPLQTVNNTPGGTVGSGPVIGPPVSSENRPKNYYFNCIIKY